MSAGDGLRALAMQAGVVEVCLGRGGREVTARQGVSEWRQGSTANHTTIQFGPFVESVEATAVLVFVNGYGPDAVDFDSTLQLPAGMPFSFELSLAVR